MNAEDAEKLINPLVTLIPVNYLNALTILNNKLKDKSIDWAISGNLGDAIQTVHVEADCIEIITNKTGAEKICKEVQEFGPGKIMLQTETLSRPAAIGKCEYSVSLRSYFLKFNMSSVLVKIFGDLQIQIADWGWGDKMKVSPDYVYVVGQKMPVVPLQVKYDLYRGLGWTDLAEKVQKVIDRKHRTRAVRTQ